MPSFFRTPRGRPASSGFTLIEVLVATAVIVSVVFAPVSIVSQHLSRNTLNARHIKAELLAQEIVEFVRCSRDSSLLASSGATDWFEDVYAKKSGIDGTAGVTTASCRADYSPCAISFAEWVRSGGSPDKHCLVTRTGGYVTGFTAGTRGTNADTCDGGAPLANHALTATLHVIIPSSSDSTRYATLESCVSWEGINKRIKRVRVRESLFDWVIRA